MIQLAAALVLLVLGHALPSLPGWRGWLIARFGQPIFFATYSLLSALTLVLVILAYRRADPGLWLYGRPADAPLVALALMPLAAFLVVGRLTTRPRETPEGIYRLSAVPGSTGVLLWAGVHLLSLGSTRQVLLFLAMAAIALVSLIKNLRLAPQACRSVGWFPGLAVLRGQQRLVWVELGWWRLLLALALYVLLLWLHPLVIGPNPLAVLG